MLSFLVAGCWSGDCEKPLPWRDGVHWQGTECDLPMAIPVAMCANPTILTGNWTADVNSGPRLRRHWCSATAVFGRSVPGSVNTLYSMAKLDAFRYLIGLAYPACFVIMVNDYY